MLTDWFRNILSEPDNGPNEDIHEDENANIGDKRYYVRPMGEIFGYDKDLCSDKIYLDRQTYRKNATYGNGKKSYAWMSGKTIFRGSIEEWEQVKENPEEHFQDIPVEWNKIVKHVDNFIDIHKENINNKTYPHGVMNIS